jgi:hypothetical protein
MLKPVIDVYYSVVRRHMAIILQETFKEAVGQPISLVEP